MNFLISTYGVLFEAVTSLNQVDRYSAVKSFPTAAIVSVTKGIAALEKFLIQQNRSEAD